MERDSVSAHSQLSRHHLRKLISVRDCAKEIRIQDTMENAEIVKHVRQIRSSLMAIKHLPKHYSSIIQDMIFKAQRYLETVC